MLQESRSAAVCSGVCVLLAGYCVHKLYRYLNRCADFSKSTIKILRVCHRRVLVLGLEGAGKSRLVQSFQCSLGPRDVIPEPKPTIGFETRSASVDGVDFLFWDVSGHELTSLQWQDLLVTSADVLVWVVDSSRPDLMAQSCDLLHAFVQQADRSVAPGVEKRSSKNLYGIPVVLVASKQDISTGLCVTEVFKRMRMEELKQKHKVYSVACGLPNLGRHRGLLQLFEVMAFSTNKRYTSSEV